MGMIKMREKLEEVVPFVGMVGMEGCTIGLTILAKSAFSAGLSPFVFVVYTNAIGSLLLLPYSFFYHRLDSTEEPLFTFPILLRIFFLGLTGVALAQNLAFVGLYHSSPIVVCAMGLLIPAFSFILAFILRTTRLEWRSASFQFKVLGTLISFMGAIVEEIYRGPYIRPSSLRQIKRFLVFSSTEGNWVLGGTLIAASSLCISIWNIIQLGTIKRHPQVMKIASFYSLAGTILCAAFSLIMERDLNAWKLKPNLELLLIIVTAIFGSVIRSSVHTSCTRKKGPFYVPMFQPFRIFWATFFGVGFFTNSLQYGSVVGAIVAGIGYYTVSWGQIREDAENKLRNSSDEKVPLLQQDEDDDEEEEQV